jgi:hypothetical protein
MVVVFSNLLLLRLKLLACMARFSVLSADDTGVLTALKQKIKFKNYRANHRAAACLIDWSSGSQSAAQAMIPSGRINMALKPNCSFARP